VEEKYMSGKRILVSSVSGDSALSVLRELTAAGHEVIGADWRKLPFGLHSRYLRGVHRLPTASEPGFDQSLVELVSAVRPDAFLPLGTQYVATACRQEAALSRLTRINLPRYEAFMAAYDHVFCNDECLQLGIPSPARYSLDEASRILANGCGKVTLVVKPCMDIGMARGVSYVRDNEALLQSVSSCTAKYGGASIQEYIPGDASAMRTVIVLFNQKSELIVAFTTRKLRYWPTSGGLTALSVSTDEFNLVTKVLPFFHKWRWRGAAEVELKYDARDGEYKVIEINPRFPAYLRLPMICGLNLARLAAELTLDNDTTIAPLKFPSYTVGVKFVNPGLFLRTALSDICSAPARVTAIRKAIADLNGTAPIVASMLSDPLPMMGRMLLDVRNVMGLKSPP
jgi:predicted ATP-grasp superfamily ATP-dependent carboligase